MRIVSELSQKDRGADQQMSNLDRSANSSHKPSPGGTERESIARSCDHRRIERLWCSHGSGIARPGRSLPQDFTKFCSGGCYVTFGGVGDADGHRFRRSGDRAVNQTFASHEFENRYAQCDAVPGFHFDELRTSGVAFHCDAWFGADGSENAVEITIILAIIPEAESDEWFGSDLLQRDGFQTSERVRNSQRDTQRVGA